MEHEDFNKEEEHHSHSLSYSSSSSSSSTTTSSGGSTISSTSAHVTKSSSSSSSLSSTTTTTDSSETKPRKQFKREDRTQKNIKLSTPLKRSRSLTDDLSVSSIILNKDKPVSSQQRRSLTSRKTLPLSYSSNNNNSTTNIKSKTMKRSSSANSLPSSSSSSSSKMTIEERISKWRSSKESSFTPQMIIKQKQHHTIEKEKEKNIPLPQTLKQDIEYRISYVKEHNIYTIPLCAFIITHEKRPKFVFIDDWKEFKREFIVIPKQLLNPEHIRLKQLAIDMIDFQQQYKIIIDVFRYLKIKQANYIISKHPNISFQEKSIEVIDSSSSSPTEPLLGIEEKKEPSIITTKREDGTVKSMGTNGHRKIKKTSLFKQLYDFKELTPFERVIYNYSRTIHDASYYKIYIDLTPRI